MLLRALFKDERSCVRVGARRNRSGALWRCRRGARSRRGHRRRQLRRRMKPLRAARRLRKKPGC